MRILCTHNVSAAVCVDIAPFFFIKRSSILRGIMQGQTVVLKVESWMSWTYVESWMSWTYVESWMSWTYVESWMSWTYAESWMSWTYVESWMSWTYVESWMSWTYVESWMSWTYNGRWMRHCFLCLCRCILRLWAIHPPPNFTSYTSSFYPST